MKLAALFLLTAMSVHAVEIIAHRGFSARAPENTLAAFELAWKSGSDACELDVYLTADGKTAVIHDKDTKRTAGVTLDVAASKQVELTALDAGSWKGQEWAGEKIPTLEQALATLPKGKQRFFIEVKCGAEIVPELKRILEPMKDRAAQLAIIAFKRDAAAESKKAMPWIKVYRLASGKTKDKKPTDLTKLIADTKADKLDGLDLGATDFPWDEAMVKQIRDAGFGVYVWTVNKPADVQRFAKLGVDGITTDDPVMAAEALR
ncbi:glycerophosphodiester phosphodiesterase [Prosthecobacter sp.]|jgi:glycerophosphoryl diester phosphodiesterase|uniref:glycerophosphodiester phosphodiesterase n=1 Tax=Prosthecobacter sp. TaxID=1965333 RepID=UPI003784B0C5